MDQNNETDQGSDQNGTQDNLGGGFSFHLGASIEYIEEYYEDQTSDNDQKLYTNRTISGNFGVS